MEILADYAYQWPFIQPLPVWDYWWALIVPLVAGVGLVWKSMKCQHVKQIPGQTAAISLWILVGFALVAGVIYVIAQ